MKFLVDTNILTRLTQPSHHHHGTARNALESLRRANHHGVIVPQVPYEFWVVCTRPASENGLGLPVQRVIAEFATIKALYARLVAAMMRHGLTHILTFNPTDFARYAGITVLAPDKLIQGVAHFG